MIREIDPKILHSELSKIRALSYHPKEDKLLCGTRGGEVYEIDKNDIAFCCLEGHYDHELWGLGTHPKKSQFVTCGEDFLMAKWDISTKKQLKHYHMEYQGIVVQYNNKGDLFAIGCYNGKTLIFDDSNDSAKLKPYPHYIGGSRTKEITEIKFSPKDEFIAIGGADAKIHIYDTPTPNPNTWGSKVHKILKGHHSSITHFDWSIDGNFMHSVCSSYELLYWDMKNYSQLKSGAS